jgi:hypothetical protein
MEKIRVLFVAANPQGTAQLSLDEEAREITKKIRMAEYRDTLEMVSCWAARPDDLLQAFNEQRPHVVHFSGHGNKSGQIILVGDDGNPKPVGKNALESLFKVLQDRIRVVVLNACYSRPQAEAIVRHIDCALGMTCAIGDLAAITFAASFYRALGFGHSVKGAFDQGRTALLLEDIPEENTPVLVCKEGVDPSKVVLIPPPQK